MADHEQAGDGLLAWITKEEPVMAAAVTTAAAGWVGDFLVAHGIQASGLVQYAEPSVTAVVLLGIGFVVRKFVTPAVDKVVPEKPPAP